jgi:hypothetical protein
MGNIINITTAIIAVSCYLIGILTTYVILKGIISSLEKDMQSLKKNVNALTRKKRELESYHAEVVEREKIFKTEIAELELEVDVAKLIIAELVETIDWSELVETNSIYVLPINKFRVRSFKEVEPIEYVNLSVM